MRRVCCLIILSLTALLAAPALCLDVLVNQVGYEIDAPKVFRVQRATDFAGDGSFSVKRVSDSAVVHSGALTRKGGLWDKFYWEGDFSALNTPGDYYVSATVDAESADSYNFKIAAFTLRDQTGVLAYQYFTTQRCGTSVAVDYVDHGTPIHWTHNACHTDDGYINPSGPQYDAAGGWHDAGDYNKFTDGFGGDGVMGLLCLYDSYRQYYDAIDANGNSIADILDEALWQARWLAKMVQPSGHVIARTDKRRIGGSTFVVPEADTDRVIGNSDDRWLRIGDENTPQEMVICGSLIRMHRVLASKGLPTEDFAQKALDIWNHKVAVAVSEGGHNNLGNGAYHLFAGLDLYAVFGQQNCWDRSLQKVDEMAANVAANVAFYDDIRFSETVGYEIGALAWFARNYSNTAQAATARTAVRALMSHNISYLADDPLGLTRRVDPTYGGGQLQYFETNSDWNGFFVGNNRLYLNLAWGAMQAYQAIGDPSYLRFAMDQYNWVMGANYNKLCMLDAAGTNNPAKYHTRYYKYGDQIHKYGKQPGVVPNGYVRVYSTGLPNMDMDTDPTKLARYQSNEGWLINNAAYAMALSEMHDFAIPRVTVSSSSFDTGTDGWTTIAWRASSYEYGTAVWNAGAGSPGGAMRCIGAGTTDNNYRSLREGAELRKAIPTTGCINAKLSYDLRTGIAGTAYSGSGIGAGTVDHNDIQEQLTVFYSTNGGSTWTEAEPWTGRAALQGYAGYATRTIDLSDASGVSNNPGFMLKFRWQFNQSADYGDLDNIVVTAQPVDKSAPSAVTSFTATPGDMRATLAWTNPTDTDFRSTVIVYKTTGYPTSPTDGTVAIEKTSTPGSNDSYTHTGLSNMATYYYAAFAKDAAQNCSPGVTASARPDGPVCFSEPFSYPVGPLSANGAWTGATGSEIVIENGSVRINGGEGGAEAVRTVDCDGDGTEVAVQMRIRSCSGTNTCWGFWIDDPAGVNLARWYGSGVTARGRIGGTASVTNIGNLTGGWDTLYCRISFVTNQSHFYFNDTLLGTLDHTGAGDRIGRIRFEKIDYSLAAGHCIYLDDLTAGEPERVAPTASAGAPSVSVTRTGPVSFSASFSEPVFGFDSASDVQVNSAGGASAGSVLIAGSGAGPYTVTLSNITGGGTLGVTVKAAAAADKAGNSNAASAASTTVRIIAADGSIAAARTQANDTPVELGSKALYLKQAGFAYIEERDRTAGIRLQGAVSPAQDQLVCLTGTMKTTGGGERYVLVGLISPCGSFAAMPLGVCNRSLLDELIGGLHVKAWGRVKPGSITGSSFVLTDGSNDAGIRVVTSSAPGVSEDEFVTITGAAGYENGRVIYKR